SEPAFGPRRRRGPSRLYSLEGRGQRSAAIFEFLPVSGWVNWCLRRRREGLDPFYGPPRAPEGDFAVFRTKVCVLYYDYLTLSEVVTGPQSPHPPDRLPTEVVRGLLTWARPLFEQLAELVGLEQQLELETSRGANRSKELRVNRRGQMDLILLLM